MDNSTIFDDVFRTLLEKMPRLTIPLINEVFHTSYCEEEKLIQLRNEHHLRNGENITDSCLLIGEKMYHIECQSNPDSTMVVRMIEYDFAIALENAVMDQEQYVIEFPRSCVLYLRHNRKTGNSVKMKVVLSDEKSFVYSVPIVKVQEYTKNEIFQKNLLFLLPFYIMRYEKAVEKIGANAEDLEKLLREYEEIREHLEVTLSSEERAKDYADMVELILRISDYIFRKTENVKKGVERVMRGTVLELQSDRIMAEGMEKGIEKGIAVEKRNTIRRMLKNGRDKMQICGDLDVSMEEVEAVERAEVSSQS